jgi:hypothetical protein
MAGVAFQGFRPELIDFLSGLRDNNGFFSGHLPGWCFEHYKQVASIQQWLNDLLAD